MIGETPKGISVFQSFSGGPADLIPRWRDQAAQYDRDGVTASARLLVRVATELEVALCGETVPLAEAARRSGYTADHLSRLVRTGKLVNVGRKHAPRFRVTDLPRKCSPMSEMSDIVGPSGDVPRQPSED